MDIDNIIDTVINDDKNTEKTPEAVENQQLEGLTLKELLLSDLSNDEVQTEIYKRFKEDIEIYLDDFLTTCKDVNADKGMYKCSLETWQAFCNNIGLFYFNKNKYLRDLKRIAGGGGMPYNDNLLCIGLTLYETLCNEYRKQFFIYDACKFLGMSLDTMYRLSDLHSELLKKAHSMQESSMRTALASGRSNVTAMAILLNHDYNYTKTTEIIHTNSNKDMTAEKLPELYEKPLNIAIDTAVNDDIL